MSLSTPILRGFVPCANARTGIAAPMNPSFSMSLRFMKSLPSSLWRHARSGRAPEPCGLLSRALRDVSDVAVGPLEIGEALARRVARIDDRADQDRMRRGGDHLRHPAVENGQGAFQHRGAGDAGPP